MSDEKQKNLKPCPFCGAEARIIKHHGRDWYIAVCNDCGASRGDFSHSRKEAAESWNQRARRFKNPPIGSDAKDA